MRYLVVLFAILLAASACEPARRARIAPAPAAQRAAAPTYTLNPGAMVRVRLTDRRVLTGTLLARFTPDSQQLVLCEAAHAPCARRDTPGARAIPARDVKGLSVHGKATGFGFYLGVYGGGLIGGLVRGSAREPNDGGMALGFLAGGALGTLIGSRVRTWVPVFPCVHACASGEYPEP